MKPLIICIAGKKQVGKNTTGDLIKYLYERETGRLDNFHFEGNQYHPVKYLVHYIAESAVFGSFAAKLKDLCIELGFVTYEQCFGSDNDKNTLSTCWKGDRQLTAREVLQEVGQFCRNLNPDCWVNALNEHWKEIGKPPLFIVTDGRYPNELEWAQENGGRVIYLKSDADTGNHPSEKSLSLEKHKNLIDLVVPGKDLMPAKEREKLIVPVVTQWFKEYGLVGE